MSGEIWSNDWALELGLTRRDAELLAEVFRQIQENRRINWTQAALNSGAPSYDAAAMAAHRFRKKLRARPEGLKLTLDLLGVSDEVLIGRVRDALDAEKTVILPKGATEQQPDHSIRLKATELAFKLRGEMDLVPPDPDKMSADQIRRMAELMNVPRRPPASGRECTGSASDD